MLNTLRRISTTSTVEQLCKRCQSSVVQQSTEGEGEESIAEKWQLYVHACITRPPMVSFQLSNLEEKFKEVVTNKEVEQSYLSRHEIRSLEENEQAKLLKESKTQAKINETVKETAIEFEDACNAEFEQFEFPLLQTDADKDGDLNSLNRALDKSLILVCSGQFGKEGGDDFLLPLMKWKQEESLRATCNRLIENKLNINLKVKVFGNAPCGFYNYKYSKAQRQKLGFTGAKVFFYSGHVMNSNLNVLKDIRNNTYLWLTHDQLADKLTRPYHNAIKQFVVKDN